MFSRENFIVMHFSKQMRPLHNLTWMWVYTSIKELEVYVATCVTLIDAGIIDRWAYFSKEQQDDQTAWSKAR